MFPPTVLKFLKARVPCLFFFKALINCAIRAWNEWITEYVSISRVILQNPFRACRNSRSVTILELCHIWHVLIQSLVLFPLCLWRCSVLGIPEASLGRNVLLITLFAGTFAVIVGHRLGNNEWKKRFGLDFNFLSFKVALLTYLNLK